MKLLFVTSLKEYQKTVADILNKAEIPVFSVTETIGFKDHHKTNLLNNWFSSGTDQFNSIFVFSFTDQVKTEKVMELINEYNAANETGFPIRAFIVPVEETSCQTT
jgi:GTPase Era involved in 16S rRNA processing